jgi:putative endonuclease
VTRERQELGRLGEDLVVASLERQGFRLLERNARVASVRGELDVIALEQGTLVFIEVKTLSASTLAGPERPAHAVGPRKQAKLRSLAGAWIAERRPGLAGFGAIRFDVVGLRVDATGRVVEWDHIRAAF